MGLLPPPPPPPKLPDRPTEGEMLAWRQQMFEHQSREDQFEARWWSWRDAGITFFLLGAVCLLLDANQIAAYIFGLAIGCFGVVGVMRVRRRFKEAHKAPKEAKRVPWGSRESRGWIRKAKVVPLPKSPKHPPIPPQPRPRVIQARSSVKCDWADMGRNIGAQTAHCVELAGFDEECKACPIGKAKREFSGPSHVQWHVSGPAGLPTRAVKLGDLVMRDNKIWIWAGAEWRQL